MLDSIKWGFFTLDEKHKIKKLYSSGQYQAITNVIDNMSPEKELEIQKILDVLPPETEHYKSKVQAKYYKNNPDGPQTPEEEAKLQWAMNNEFSAYKEKLAKKKLKTKESMKKSIEQKKEIKKIKAELKKETKKDVKKEENKGKNKKETVTKEKKTVKKTK